MCTVIILRRPDHPWPLLLAANRDEMKDRPWRGPGRHWPDRPDVVAGLDELATGTWLGLNDTGVVAAMLNRTGTLGPSPGKRSRGELALEALDHADATDAATALGALESASYRSFNMIVADNRDAFWLRSSGEGRVEVREIPLGLSMLTARDLNDLSDPRIAAFLPRFEAAPAPDPGTDDWSAWQALLAARTAGTPEPEAALVFQRASGFGTVSSALIALPGIDRQGEKPRWLFAAGKPGEASYLPVSL